MTEKLQRNKISIQKVRGRTYGDREFATVNPIPEKHTPTLYGYRKHGYETTSFRVLQEQQRVGGQFKNQTFVKCPDEPDASTNIYERRDFFYGISPSTTYLPADARRKVLHSQAILGPERGSIAGTVPGIASISRVKPVSKRE